MLLCLVRSLHTVPMGRSCGTCCDCDYWVPFPGHFHCAVSVRPLLFAIHVWHSGGVAFVVCALSIAAHSVHCGLYGLRVARSPGRHENRREQIRFDRRYGTAAAWIILGIVLTETVTDLRIPTWATELGNASYSLYLHYPLLSVLCKIGVHLVPTSITAVYLYFVFCIFTCSITSYVFYRLIERPLLNQLRNLFLKKPQFHFTH